MSDVLFDMQPVVPTPEPGENLSAGQRLTIRQREAIARGVHPLASPVQVGLRVHEDAERKCGNCRFRSTGNRRNGRSYPKCLLPGINGGYPRCTGGAATDVRAWWPGCTDHEWGDPKVSPDAARWKP